MNSDHWDLGVFIYKNLLSTEVVYNNVVASSLCLYNYTLVLKLYAAYTILIKIYTLNNIQLTKTKTKHFFNILNHIFRNKDYIFFKVG